MHRLLFLTTLALSGTLAFAHSGVKNPAVMARMNLMSDVGAATKVLGEMAKGTRPFDADTASTARATLLKDADQIALLFEAEEGDPKSEALPDIWTDWAGFMNQTDKMRKATESLDVSSLDTLREGMAAIGQSCSSCHEAYRIKK
jgi:cytochrome c556